MTQLPPKCWKPGMRVRCVKQRGEFFGFSDTMKKICLIGSIHIIRAIDFSGGCTIMRFRGPQLNDNYDTWVYNADDFEYVPEDWS